MNQIKEKILNILEYFLNPSLLSLSFHPHPPRYWNNIKKTNIYLPNFRRRFFYNFVGEQEVRNHYLKYFPNLRQFSRPYIDDIFEVLLYIKSVQNLYCEWKTFFYKIESGTTCDEIQKVIFSSTYFFTLFTLEGDILGKDCD